MANYCASHPKHDVDVIFRALADPTRRRILERVAEHDLTVTEAAKPFNFSLPTISRHLSVLERAELIGRDKVGREHRIRFKPEAMRTVADYVSFYKKFWNARADSLEKFLEKND